MFLALLLFTFGCAARVSCEVLAYQGYAQWAWRVLPWSAVLELTALTTFGVNMIGTFILQPVDSVREPMVARIAGLDPERLASHLSPKSRWTNG
jgi:hypothetical protein